MKLNAQSLVDTTLYAANKSATFPGGIKGLYDFIAKNIQYPKSAIADKYKERVGVQITVNQDGIFKFQLFYYQIISYSIKHVVYLQHKTIRIC